MNRIEKIQNQVELSKGVERPENMVAIVVSTKLTKKARKEHFGFRFAEKAEVGRVIINDDFSISTIEAIV